MASSGTVLPVSEEEVKLYTIHISSKYLNRTRQKLELTRLPHDVPQPNQTEWWEPKSTIEPLVDYWLEHHSWRHPEAESSARVAQFRTAIPSDDTGAPVRLHFVHSLSSSTSAVPLLLIPPFPFTNLSLTHLIDRLITPSDSPDDVSFHLVMPSLPGLGFSDAISSNEYMIPLVVELFDKLMKRLGYQHYLATTATPSPNAITDIDMRLINHMATSFPESCLGVHMISPPFTPPTPRKAPLAWIKWRTVAALRRPCLGYSRDDVATVQRRRQKRSKHKQPPLLPGINTDVSKVFNPNTLAYALCDSPAGLLLFIVMILRLLGPTHEFSHQEIIHMTELMWLPGPEGTLRMWAHCASMSDNVPRMARKPRVGITAFTGATDDVSDQSQGVLPMFDCDGETCLAWGTTRYNIVSSQRVSGRPGLLAWERPEVIVTGVKKLAKAIIAVDGRLRPAEAPGQALLEQVVVEGHDLAPAEVSGTTIQGAVSPVPAPLDTQQTGQRAVLAGDDASKQKPPLTPSGPETGESSRMALMESGGDTGQSSDQDSPSTIKPSKSSPP